MKKILSLILIVLMMIAFNSCSFGQNVQNFSSETSATNETCDSESGNNNPDMPDTPAEKPVIYLYPEHKTNVSVKLDLDGELLCTYPEYHNGWNVTAAPDGTLTDSKGMKYNYLFWEANLNNDYNFSEGFCVKGSDTAAFLEKALTKLGLNRHEANEFIVYWLERMEDNPYNVISFQTAEYTEAAKLNISPKPDTLIRVFMAWHASDNKVEIQPQTLTAPERGGFTAVEWGGCETK